MACEHPARDLPLVFHCDPLSEEVLRLPLEDNVRVALKPAKAPIAAGTLPANTWTHGTNSPSEQHLPCAALRSQNRFAVPIGNKRFLA